MLSAAVIFSIYCTVVYICGVQGGSNMTGTDLCVNKSQFVPVILEPPCNLYDTSVS
jgi:hypothetical protein